MKKMICVAALFLTGCGCWHCVVRPPLQDTPAVPVGTGETNSVTPTHVTPPEDVPALIETGETVRESSLPRKSEADRIKEVNGALEDAFFRYDRSELTPDALASLRRDADLLCAILADFPALKVTVEGHCDERGSAEYNLALGDRRARRAEGVLRECGVPAGAVEVVSYGKEAPQCLDATETCWQKNRRAHMSVRR
jgi:peptidoglycan-associated lipoprotein